MNTLNYRENKFNFQDFPKAEIKSSSNNTFDFTQSKIVRKIFKHIHILRIDYVALTPVNKL